MKKQSKLGVWKSFGAMALIGATAFGGMAIILPAVTQAASEPVISAIGSSNVSSTSATITWTTDQAASSQVVYGTNTFYGATSTLGTTEVTNHAVTISGLTPSTTYHFAAISTNASGTTMSADQTLLTASTISTSTAPTATAGTVTTTRNTAVSGTLNASDTNSPALPLTFSIASNPANGTLSNLSSSTGNFTFTPNTNFTGTDTFTFMANNGVLNSNTATETIAVQPTTTTTTAPTANAGSLSTNRNMPVSGSLSATNPSGGTLSFAIASNPSNGTLSGFSSSTGAFTFTPNSNFTGTDSFTFTAASNGMTSNTGTETITVNTTNTTSTVGQPVISSIVATPSDTQATIIWTTDQAATSQVNFGTSAAYSASTTPNMALTTSHSVTITGLTPSTMYHFQVLSTNSGGTSVMSADQTFTTTVTLTGTTSIADLQARVQRIEQEIVTLQQAVAALQQGTTGTGGISTTTTSTTGVSATIEPQNASVRAGTSIDFGGRNFGIEEPVAVTLNGATVTTAHADGGGNFTTGSLPVSSTTGTQTYTFTGRNSGIVRSTTITITP